MMLKSNVFIVLLLFLVRAAIYFAPQLFRVVLRVSGCLGLLAILAPNIQRDVNRCQHKLVPLGGQGADDDASMWAAIQKRVALSEHRTHGSVSD
jgi:hypothetical protein